MSEKNILISGCSGGGKSSLLDELSRHGFATVNEPGRRIVVDELSETGKALPWVNLKAFARRAVEMAKSDLSTAKTDGGIIFFDRGLIDAAVALEFAGGPPLLTSLGTRRHYAKKVFLTPPWPEIYVTDPERQHDLSEAIQEYGRLVRAFADLGYDACEIPKAPVRDRAKFVLQELGVS
ncbi:AAA family ATPase [Yoonia sp. 2307UL14-13]|uniref:AAA family ATPase n=1 Tax=Yoonia sp. 2307UL14-13 TaxID=3126506 RepID=UPI0030AA3EF4